jgi:hypothetical protein
MEQVNRLDIERDGFATTGGSIGITKSSASYETKRWLENMTADQLAKHKEKEQEFIKRKANDYHY